MLKVGGFLLTTRASRGVSECAIVLCVFFLINIGISERALAGPCEQIVQSCRQAGFQPGEAADGYGLQVDCVRPIMRGGVQPVDSSKDLPTVNPRLVARCKAARPNFGQGKAAKTPVAAAAPAPALPKAAPPPDGKRRPNIVFILTDDLSDNLIQFMPNVAKMQQEGATFTNYFVTDSLCCPSRTSIFTGRYPHETGVFRNTGPDGGYSSFISHNNDSSTFAVSLAAAGYSSAMLGKYLNGYRPAENAAGAGWTHWAVAGNGYSNFNYRMNQDGKVVSYGEGPDDYLTDVVSRIAADLAKKAKGTPFAIEIASFAPHATVRESRTSDVIPTAVPAPRDAQAFPGLTAPRGPAFDATPGPDAPEWLRLMSPLSGADKTTIDEAFRKRAQSVIAVDLMIGKLRAAVEAIGETPNTYFVFSSDNGFHMGEHRMMPGKMTAFDMDIHVPLVIVGPDIQAGLKIDDFAENIDLSPTFSDLGYAPILPAVSGRSLVPLLRGAKPDGWRTAALVEHHGPLHEPADPDLPTPRSGNPPSYESLRTKSFVYVEYANGEHEYHDLRTDPDELANTFSKLSAAQKAELHQATMALAQCHGADGCHAVDHPALGSLAQ